MRVRRYTVAFICTSLRGCRFAADDPVLGRGGVAPCVPSSGFAVLLGSASSVFLVRCVFLRTALTGPAGDAGSYKYDGVN